MLNQRRLNYLNNIQDYSMSVFFSGKRYRSTADQFFPFTVNRNFFYLTGLEQENIALLIIKGNGVVNATLYFDETDEITAKWDGRGYTHLEAVGISSITEIKSRIDLENDLAMYFEASRKSQYGVIDKVYLDLERNSYHDDLSVSERFANDLKNKYPATSIFNNYFILSNLRLTKDEIEIKEIKKALAITKEAINTLYSKVKPQINESILVAHYNFILNTHGVTPSFSTIMASGLNATILHYENNNAIIGANDLILCDSGVYHNNYASDITRTFPASGKFTPRQKDVYNAVLNVNKAAIEWLSPGKTLADFQKFGRDSLAKEAIKLGLINKEEDISKYYYHGLGHYLGLDVHDVGRYDVTFKEGMVITVEPGLYIEEEKIGIRIEDNILITKDGHLNLSSDIIKEVSEIELFMKTNNK